MPEYTKKTINRFHLSKLNPEKLYKVLQGIFDGDYLYKTHDGRVIDFFNGFETKSPIWKTSK